VLIDPFHDDSQAGDTLFRDVLSLVLLGFLSIIVVLLPHINPEGVEQSSNAPVPGTVIVEMTWADDLDIDLDLWVRAPGDIPVGYSNKGGVVFDLLRDDLGKTMDLSPINHETAVTRGIVAGEYIINAHAYRYVTQTRDPVRVQTVVSVKKLNADGKPFVVPILYTTAEFLHQGQELTLVRFTLTEAGELVKNSVHSIYQELRTKQHRKGK